jgi:hypothetical protein
MMRMLGAAAAGALMGALLNAIRSDRAHLRLWIAPIFGLAALLALFPATLGRSRIPARANGSFSTRLGPQMTHDTRGPNTFGE